MSPRIFLQAGGALLMLLAVLGFLRPDLAGGFWSFDSAENWARLVLGAAMLLIAPMPSRGISRSMAAIIGMIFVGLGMYGFTVSGNPEPNAFGLVQFENPVDNVMHAFFGVWGVLAAVLNRRREIL